MMPEPATPAIDVGELIERTRVRAFHVRLVLLGALVALIDGFDMSSIGATTFTTPSRASPPHAPA